MASVQEELGATATAGAAAVAAANAAAAADAAAAQAAQELAAASSQVQELEVQLNKEQAAASSLSAETFDEQEGIVKALEQAIVGAGRRRRNADHRRAISVNTTTLTLVQDEKNSLKNATSANLISHLQSKYTLQELQDMLAKATTELTTVKADHTSAVAAAQQRVQTLQANYSSAYLTLQSANATHQNATLTAAHKKQQHAAANSTAKDAVDAAALAAAASDAVTSTVAGGSSSSSGTLDDVHTLLIVTLTLVALLFIVIIVFAAVNMGGGGEASVKSRGFHRSAKVAPTSVASLQQPSSKQSTRGVGPPATLPPVSNENVGLGRKSQEVADLNSSDIDSNDDDSVVAANPPTTVAGLQAPESHHDVPAVKVPSVFEHKQHYKIRSTLSTHMSADELAELQHEHDTDPHEHKHATN